MMRFNSLSFRLVALAAAWTLFVLPVTALVLRYVYQESVQRNFQLALDADLSVLASSLALASRDEEGNLIIPKLPDPEYGIPISGWYWQIKLLNAEEGTQKLYHSESLLDEKLLDLPSKDPSNRKKKGIFSGHIMGPEKQRLYAVEREFELGESDQKFSVVVTRNSAAIIADVNDFTWKLGWALFVLGIGLVLAPVVQVQIGLRPLRVISQGLADIRSGKTDKLAGQYPAEIEPLQKELNALIDSNHEIVERARMHVGNLAHALKTPLSVISNEANAKEDNFADKVIEQSHLMRDQITHYLDRARMAARVNVIGTVTEIAPALDALVRVLSRIYEEKNVLIESNYSSDFKFQGEKQDLEEMVGNLLDNACKWAESKVYVSGRELPYEEQKRLEIIIEDDGPGLSEAEMEQAMKRGRRLDESKPGSGLGLSIVAELAHLYKGEFQLKKSSKGGLKAKLILPLA